MRLSLNILALSCAIAAVGSAQNTLHVPRQFATIQAAIDAAQTNDTVLVAPGVYGPIDYKQKSIIVKSSQGPFLTTIHGFVPTPQTRPGVTMTAAGATLEGFAVERHKGSVSYPCSTPTCYGGSVIWALGGGIWAGGGVVIKNNIVRNNGTRRGNWGAGIFAGGGALIQGNLIIGNDAGAVYRSVPCSCGGLAEYGQGGGIYGWGPVFLANNVITGNTAWTGAGICVRDATLVNNIIAGNNGDGIANWFGGAIQIGNCSIVRNTGYGLTVRPAGPVSIVNSIVRDNMKGEIVANAPTVTYSNVKGGYAGAGNFDADPQFVDASRGDYHLLFPSTSRDAGTTQTPLPAQDFEGNARVVGASVDVGADEFDDRLYVTGNPRPGGLVHVKLIGTPGLAVYWAYSVNPTLQNPPVIIPGAGAFYLKLPLFVLSAGSIPPTGIVIIPVPIPAALPSGTVIPLQGLIGPKLTNPWVQVFK